VLSARSMSVERDGRAVVEDLDLELCRGEITVLLGPNGAGKSSLLAALSGLIPARAESFEIAGRVASANQVAALARRSALANVEAALGWWGVAKPQRRVRARAALDQLGVGHLAGRDGTRLSGGEARRVHLARALAVEADVLLLDEPFSGLDAPTRADLLSDLRAVLGNSGPATLIVVHDRSEALAVADRIVVLIAGRKVAEATPTELFRSPPSIAVAEFLGYDGRLARTGRLLLTRPSQVRLDPAGSDRGTVTRVIPVEDGTRLEIETAEGAVVAAGPALAPAVGTEVRLTIDGGVWFDRPTHLTESTSPGGR
jgi:ABC-type sulfate/molybdate transport systems ATPase subunit